MNRGQGSFASAPEVEAPDVGLRVNKAKPVPNIRLRTSNPEGPVFGVMILLWVVMLSAAAAVGKMALEYVAMACFAATLPFWPALIGGLFLSETTIPLAIFLWVLHAAGVAFPLFH